MSVMRTKTQAQLSKLSMKSSSVEYKTTFFKKFPSSHVFLHLKICNAELWNWEKTQGLDSRVMFFILSYKFLGATILEHCVKCATLKKHKMQMQWANMSIVQTKEKAGQLNTKTLSL